MKLKPTILLLLWGMPGSVLLGQHVVHSDTVAQGVNIHLLSSPEVSTWSIDPDIFLLGRNQIYFQTIRDRSNALHQLHVKKKRRSITCVGNIRNEGSENRFVGGIEYKKNKGKILMGNIRTRNSILAHNNTLSFARPTRLLDFFSPEPHVELSNSFYAPLQLWGIAGQIRNHRWLFNQISAWQKRDSNFVHTSNAVYRFKKGHLHTSLTRKHQRFIHTHSLMLSTSVGTFQAQTNYSEIGMSWLFPMGRYADFGARFYKKLTTQQPFDSENYFQKNRLEMLHIGVHVYPKKAMQTFLLYQQEKKVGKQQNNMYVRISKIHKQGEIRGSFHLRDQEVQWVRLHGKYHLHSKLTGKADVQIKRLAPFSIGWAFQFLWRWTRRVNLYFGNALNQAQNGSFFYHQYGVPNRFNFVAFSSNSSTVYGMGRLKMRRCTVYGKQQWIYRTGKKPEWRTDVVVIYPL